MSRCFLRVAIACMLGAGVGCTSAPIRYYTLTAPADRDGPAAAVSTPAIEVRLDHPTAQLHRAELMSRNGPAEVMLLENERFATPADVEIKNALRGAVQRRLRLGPVLAPEATKLTLDIDVQHFEAELGRYALLEVSWRATLQTASTPAAGTPTASCSFRAEERLTAGYAEMVAGYQRDISALAEAIVAALTKSADSTYMPCR